MLQSMQINCEKSFILKRRCEIMLHIWLKYLSFAFGIISLVLSIIAILKAKKSEEATIYLVYGSFVLAVFTLSFVVIYRSILIGLEDWTAFKDTKLGFQLLAALLPSLAISLNGLALGIRKKNSK